MNKHVVAAIASLFLSVSPAHALAEDATPPSAVPAPAAQWSLGGGVAFSSLGYVSTRSTALSSLLGPVLAVPGATGTLERRLSDRSWMFLNLAGSVRRDRADVPAGSTGYTRDDARQVTATVGLRRVLTGRRAPVEVSTVVGIHGGFVDSERRLTYVVSSTRETQTTWFAGASFGIAAQRELTEGLALRLSTPLLFGTYSEASDRFSGQPKITSTGLNVAVAIAPQLELVVFF